MIFFFHISPLPSESEAGIFRQILRGKLDLESEPWPSISDSAKDLVRKMLIRDPTKRFTAHEVLCKFSAFMPSLPLYLRLHMHACAPVRFLLILIMPGHPWIVDDAVAPDKPIDSAVLSRLKNFSAMNKLKKMALRVRSLYPIVVCDYVANKIQNFV